jgi:hypothetical protein
MSSYAGVYIHGKEIYAWRNEIDPTFLFLFTREEIRRAPKNWRVMADDDDTEYVYLTASAKTLSDRLDVLGIGRRVVDEALRGAVQSKLGSLKEVRSQVGAGLDAAIGLFEQMSLDGWINLVAAALKSPGDRWTMDGYDPKSLRQLLQIWDDYDPRYLLRALLLVCEPDDEISLDVTDLIGGGWIRDDIDPHAIALEHFSYALENGSPAVIITEGSTDIMVLEATMRVRYPHLRSFIRFFDFGDGAEGSASAGIRTLKSFAAAGINNRVVLVLDNDSAARDAERALRGIKLPDHYSVLRYPDLDLAQNYPTLGPGGLRTMDVNGLAGSIELYLGTDVLTREDGTLNPVQWRSYIEGTRSYQGEVIDKAMLRKKFLAKAKAAQADPQAMNAQDWSGLEAIVNVIVEDLRK